MALSIIDPKGENYQFDGDYKRIGSIKPGWNASGDATPHSIASSTGGTGQINFSASQANGESDLLIARDILADGNLGKINSISLQGENVSVSSDTILARLNAVRTASPWATNHAAGDLPLPRNTTLTVASVTRTFAQESFIIHGSDAHGGYLYFYGNSKDAIGWFPVVVRMYDDMRYESMWSPTGGTPADLSGTSGGAFTIDRVNNFIYLANLVQTGGAYIKKYTLTGTFVSEYRPGVVAGSAATVAVPYLAVDNSGNVYISGGPTGFVIQKFNSAGVFQAAIGTHAITGDYGFTNQPVLIAFDGTYLVTTPTSRLWPRLYTTALVYYDSVGGPVGTALEQPTGLAIDRSNLVIYLSSDGSQGPLLRSYTKGDYSDRSTISVPSADKGMVTDGKGRVFIPDQTFPLPYSLAQNSLNVIFARDGSAKLSTMLHYYLTLILDVGDFNYSFSAVDPTVIFPGWTDNVWEKVKELCAAYSLQIRHGVTPAGTGYQPTIEIVDVEQSPTPLDQTVAQSLGMSLNLNNVVRSYTIVNQNTSEAPVGNFRIVYSSSISGQTFGVDVEQTVFTQVQVEHSLVSVRAVLPELAAWEEEVAGYQVWDSEGKQLPYGLFTSMGGSVSASLADDRTINLALTGPYVEITGYPGPYNFGNSAVGRLNITGSGTFRDPIAVTIWTGADESYVTDDTGPRIDSPFITNLDQLYNRAAWASLELSGPRIELSFDVGPDAFPTLGDRITFNYQSWRIMTKTKSGNTTTVTALPYTTVAEKDAAWTGKTVTQYDTFWSGYRVYDSKVRPLQVTR